MRCPTPSSSRLFHLTRLFKVQQSRFQMVGDAIIEAGFKISRASRIHLTQAQAAQLYSVHEGKFFYARLVRHMTRSVVV